MMNFINLPPSHNIRGKAVISQLELEYSANEAIFWATEDLQRTCIRKIFSRYSTNTADENTGDTIINIDCYVFNRDELKDLLMKAYDQGRNDPI